jgi:hypothetical protein
LIAQAQADPRCVVWSYIGPFDFRPHANTFIRFDDESLRASGVWRSSGELGTWQTPACEKSARGCPQGSSRFGGVRADCDVSPRPLKLRRPGKNFIAFGNSVRRLDLRRRPRHLALCGFSALLTDIHRAVANTDAPTQKDDVSLDARKSQGSLG